ncbi:MAG TPA: dUTP diphosphatase [Gammaproteobacteria bacterium]|nr:dUTP diphosphatase [Gammaproteobacteria bacterium]
MSDSLAAKARVMLQMQDDMNARVDRDWIERGREWYRAVWIECAELMDHYGGWKWWKKSAGDREQALLEIVDIWHFGLSMRITPARDFGRAAAAIAAEWRSPLACAGFLDGVERLALAALGERRFEVAAIPALLAELGRGYDDLYRAYVGKNVLNFFRQDHGYRDGSYLKSWHGREDNEHLVEVLADLDSDAEGFRAAVYDGLAVRYRAACASR